MGKEGKGGSLERGALKHRCYEGEREEGGSLTAEEEGKRIQRKRETGEIKDSKDF